MIKFFYKNRDTLGIAEIINGELFINKNNNYSNANNLRRLILDELAEYKKFKNSCIPGKIKKDIKFKDEEQLLELFNQSKNIIVINKDTNEPEYTEDDYKFNINGEPCTELPKINFDTPDAFFVINGAVINADFLKYEEDDETGHRILCLYKADDPEPLMRTFISEYPIYFHFEEMNDCRICVVMLTYDLYDVAHYSSLYY